MQRCAGVGFGHAEFLEETDAEKCTLRVLTQKSLSFIGRVGHLGDPRRTCVEGSCFTNVYEEQHLC